MKTADKKISGSSACLQDKRIPFINITNNIGRQLIFKKKLYVDLERLNIITYMNSKTVVTRSGRSAKSITHNLIPRRSGKKSIVEDNKLNDISNDVVEKEKRSSRRISNTKKTEKVSDTITAAKKIAVSESDVIPINKRTSNRIRIDNDLKIDKQIKSNNIPAKTERNVNKKVNLRQKQKNISIDIAKEDTNIENSSNINLGAIKQTIRNVKVVTSLLSTNKLNLRQKLNNSSKIDILPLNKEAENLDKSQSTNLDAINQVKRDINKIPISNKINFRQKLNNSSKNIPKDKLPLNKEAASLENSPNINLDGIKQVNFLNTSTPLVKRLRVKPAVNFKNNSLNDSTDNSIIANTVSNDKVPIYKRPIIGASTKKKEKDVYKFDFAEEKKRDNAELNPYDKGMDKELDAIIKNEQKKVERSKARKRKIAEKKFNVDRKTKKETVVIPKAKKIMDFKDLLTLKNKLLLEKSNSNAKQNLPEFNVNISITKNKDNSAGIFVLEHVVINSPRGEDKFDKLLAEKKKNVFPQVNKSSINSRIASPILDFECISSNSHTESINTDQSNLINNNEPEIEVMDVSNNFGFNDDLISLQSPDANSTMLHLKEVSRKLQKRYPWRPSLIVKSKRYLSTKDSSLPNVEQDLVLNSTIVDRLCYSKIDKTVENEQIDEVKETETTPAKKIVQTSIHSYLLTDKSNNNNKDLNVSTLFNDENLSPIKSLNQSKSVLQNSPVRRSILTSLNDNNFFGFNSPVKKRFEDRNGVLSPKNKPTRIDLPEIQLYKQSNQIEDAAEKPTEEVEVPVNPEELPEKTQEKDTLKTLGLFEEFDSAIKKNTQRTYRRKRNRQEPDCQQSDGSFEATAKIKSMKKKKKVDIQFESDADKWAEQFNKMCDDVDKHELHIE